MLFNTICIIRPYYTEFDLLCYKTFCNMIRCSILCHRIIMKLFYNIIPTQPFCQIAVWRQTERFWFGQRVSLQEGLLCGGAVEQQLKFTLYFKMRKRCKPF